MKTQNTSFLQTPGKSQLENLVNEVKETIATNVPFIRHEKAFSSTDLWNLERSRRTRSIRRHLA